MARINSHSIKISEDTYRRVKRLTTKTRNINDVVSGLLDLQDDTKRVARELAAGKQ